MAVRYYDEALVKKLRGWIKDPNMTVTSPDETRRLFEYRADVTNDSPIKLPLIALRRGKTVSILSTNKRPLTFDGATLASTADKSTQLNCIPISLNYQLDIYTRYFDESDEYMRNFVFNIINYPKLDIVIPYNDSNIQHTSNIRLVQDVEDNSDIPERLIPGQFTRVTLNIVLDDAYLFSVPVRDNYTIETITEIKLKDN